MRIRIPSLKRNPLLAEEIDRLLRSLVGIKSVSVNTVTGSMVVHFDQDRITSQAVLSLLSREGYVELSRAVPHEKYIDAALAKVGEAASKALIGYALDRAFQGTPLALVAAFI
jgi:hypothetical protein